MDKPKIFVFTTSYHPFIGGAEIAIQETVKRLSPQFDFFIFTARFSRMLPKMERYAGGTIVRLGLGTSFDKWLLPFWGLFYLLWKLGIGSWRKEKSRIALWGMDLSQGSLTASLVKLAFPGISFVFTLQYGYGEERIARGRFGFVKKAFHRILERADQVTAISNHLSAVIRAYGYCGPLALIPNGVDTEKFKKIYEVEPRKFDKNAKVVITVSRLVRKNGVDVLIEAIALVKKKIPNILCHIVGDGPEKARLMAQVKDRKLEKNVRFSGTIPYAKVPAALHEADLFVRPSRSEGMGNAFAEALAAGLPVVGTNVGGIPDIIIDQKTGLFAKTDDSADLAEKIIFVLRNEKFARNLADAGAHRVAQQFSWNRIAESYRALFEGAIAARKTILIATGLFPPDIGGPATYSKLLVDELPRRGFRVRVVSFGRVRHLPKLVRHVVYGITLLKQARYADSMLALDPVSVGVPAVLVARVLRKKLFMKIVGDYAWEQGTARFGVAELLDDFLKKKYKWRVELLRKIERWSAKSARAIIVPSFYLKKVIEQWGVSGSRIAVIPNACESSSLEISREDAWKTLALNGRVILSVGRLVPWKGFGALIEVVARLVPEIPDISLVIIGSGPEQEHIEATIRKFRMEGRVLLAGNLAHDKVLMYLKAGDLFVLNTGYEGFSHTLLEAMAQEIPVITTRIGGNPEIISHQKNGILVGYNDKEGLKEAVKEVLRMDGESRTRLIKEAAATARGFNKERTIKELIEVIETN